MNPTTIRKQKVPRVMIAGIASGSGKTTMVCAILQEFKKRSLSLAACKCGPDYIDLMFHRAITGAKTANLDLYFTPPEVVREILYQNGVGTDITIIEGVMGYYDGMQLGKDTASSYDIAKQTETPVILAVSCKGMSLSLVAIVKGVLEFRKDSNIQGILLNGISKEMYERIKPIVEEETKILVVGFLPPLSNFRLESRHLGLVTPDEIEDLQDQLDYLSEIARESIDLDAILGIAKNAPELEIGEITNIDSCDRNEPNVKIRIGYAYDQAFCFYYQENLRMLENMGATLVPFSPLRDTELPDNLHGLLLGGGYPEVYAKQLADNISMRKSIKEAIGLGTPCIAECGGFMYLHERVQGKDEEWYEMLGVIKGDCYKTKKLVRFGYVTLTAKEQTRYLDKDEIIRGHEFHYWDSTNTGVHFTATKTSSDLSYPTIHAKDNLLAGYPHLYYHSNPRFVKRFMKMCSKRLEI
ncbi:cobyrinate a,c-diamide synthase [Anaerosporobacter sp.]